MPQPELLDKEGFIWTDPNGQTWKVCMWETSPWLFWKHPDGQFVSHRRLSQAGVWMYEAEAFPERHSASREAFGELLLKLPVPN